MKAEIGSYRFVKANETLIEVYDINDDEFPTSFIRLNPGDISSEKKFQLEVMDWISKNVK